MAQIETWLKQDVKQLVSVVPLRGNIFSGDNDGNLIGVEVFEDGQPYNMTGNCYGYAVRADNQTEYFEGTIEGNKAFLILPDKCYAVIGPISIVIKTGVSVDENEIPHGGVTLAACTSYVYRTQTDVVDDADVHLLPSIDQLDAKIQAMEQKLVEAGRVNVTSQKVGKVLTITTTDRNGQSMQTTITEPTLTITPNDGDFDVNINGVKEVTIPNPNKELSDRAHVETVSRSKTRTGNPIVIEDAVAEIADKTVIKLEPRQDLHGYDHPWVGGAGKNLLKYPYTNTTVTRNGITFTDNGDGTITLNGTSTETTTDFTVVSISNGMPLANGDYILTGILESGTVDSTSASAIYLHAKGDVSESSYTNFQPDVGAGRERTITIINGSMYNFTLRVGTSGVTFTDYKIKLMLRSASNTDASYEPYQNICPITGYDTVNVTRTGKNLLELPKYSELNGLKFIREDDGTLSISGTSTGTVTQYLYRSETNGVLTGEYIITIEGTISMGSGDGGIYASNADKTRYFGQIKTDKIQIANNGINNIWFYASSGTTVSASHLKVSITRKTEDFVPGKFASYPIAVSLAEDSNHNPAGTVYSGTVTVNADGSGTVVVDRKAYDMGAAVNYKHATYTSCFGLNVNLYTEWASGIVEGTVSSVFPVDLSIDFSYNSSNNYPDNTMFRNSGNKTVYLKCSAYANMTLEEVQTALTGQTIVVPITPVTYELTANQVQTLLGYNYIYTDGVEMTLTYRQQTLASNDTLLKLLPTGTATGNPAVISDGAEGVPLKNLTVNIEPKQEGTGDPSPSNVRPISGWTAVDVVRTNGTDSEEEGYEEKTYSISLPSEAGTVYGGTLTLDQNGEGKLVVDKAFLSMKELPNSMFSSTVGEPFIRFIQAALPYTRKLGTTEDTAFISSEFAWALNGNTSTLRANLNNGQCGGQTTNSIIWFCDDRLANCSSNDEIVETFKSIITYGHVVYPIAEPFEYTLTAEQVKTLLGTNCISCDAGSLDLTYYADINSRIQAILSQINDGTGVSF